ncbi:MAG: exodeoxyribonuclease V subunit gamma, partial [Candidatus Regiella insecticola]|nr:exodeoxyribonuclease V subunit gamma [Candidatus Regiella insecticola]
ASWGRLGRDHLYLLSQFDDIQEIHAFADVEPDNLLHTVQHDMLELEDHAVIGTTVETLSHSDQKRLLDPQD